MKTRDGRGASGSNPISIDDDDDDDHDDGGFGILSHMDADAEMEELQREADEVAASAAAFGQASTSDSTSRRSSSSSSSSSSFTRVKKRAASEAEEQDEDKDEEVSMACPICSVSIPPRHALYPYHASTLLSELILPPSLIVQRTFPVSTPNAKINEHVDTCLSADAIRGLASSGNAQPLPKQKKVQQLRQKAGEGKGGGGVKGQTNPCVPLRPPGLTFRSLR